jgi:hypothetical protein
MSKVQNYPVIGVPVSNYTAIIPVAVNVESVSILPSAPPATVVLNNNYGFDEGKVKDFLSAYKWPNGLQDTFVRNLTGISFRYFICDDSGSMSTSDGHNLIDSAVGKR